MVYGPGIFCGVSGHVLPELVAGRSGDVERLVVGEEVDEPLLIVG